MRPVLSRSLWCCAAAIGVSAAVQTLAQDGRPGVLPAVPPLPSPDLVAPRPSLTGPQVPSGTYTQPAPSRPTFSVQPSPSAPQSQIAPAPAPVPDSGYHQEAPGNYGSPAPYSASPPYVGHPAPYAPQRRYAGYQPDQGVDPSLYYNDSAPYGGSYPAPIGSPYYYGMGSGGGNIRYPYYSYRRPWYNPGPAIYTFDTNVHW